MYIYLQHLFQLPVYTRSGIYLGRVRDIKLDINLHCINKYLVHSGFFKKQEYLISPPQIVEITAEKIIVDDAILKERAAETVKKEASAEPVLGSMMPRSEVK